MEDMQKLIVDNIENLLEIEPTKNENDPNLFDVELYNINTNDLILISKAYIYKSKFKLIINDLKFLLGNSKEKVITIKADDIPITYKIKVGYKNRELEINRCRLSSDFRIFFSESTLTKIEPVELVFLLKESQDLLCIKS